MAEVLRFPRHKLHGAHCCDRSDCYPCTGGLALCVTCGGAEGSLPTDCPGERVSFDRLIAIANGRLDYRRRAGWVELTCEAVG